MINVIIYLDDEKKAEEIALDLVSQKMGACASIDVENNYYQVIDGKVCKIEHVVLTVQTKSLLFNQLTEYVEELLGKEVPIYALPLISANKFFDNYMRENTKKV